MDDSTTTDAAQAEDDPLLEELRMLLLDRYQGHVEHLQNNVDHLRAKLVDVEEQINDQEALVATIKPVIADAIGASIHESRDEMVDALYPIMGRLVSRAVAEAIRDLARAIDTQMRNAFSLRAMVRRTKALATGVPDSALLLRDALPYEVLEVYLIHREQGLLLAHVASQANAQQSRADSEMIGSMLTAIRDFANDAFGRGERTSLTEVHYGDKQIVMEATTLAYMAAVVQGIAPHDLRERMRGLLINFIHAHRPELRSYDGDATRFRDAERQLAALLTPTPGASSRSTAQYQSPQHAAVGALLPRPTLGGLPISVCIVFLLCALSLALFLWRLVALVTASLA